MDKERTLESSVSTKYVHREGGEWYMRLDESSRGVKIPKDVARAIVFAFQLQKRRQSESNMRTRRIYADINCHKTALHAIGVIDSGYNPKDSYNISFFPSEQYVPYRSIENLEEHLHTVGGKGTLLFVQCKMHILQALGNSSKKSKRRVVNIRAHQACKELEIFGHQAHKFLWRRAIVKKRYFQNSSIRKKPWHKHNGKHKWLVNR